MVGSRLGLTLSMPTWSPSAAHPSSVILDLDSTTHTQKSDPLFACPLKLDLEFVSLWKYDPNLANPLEI
jgi:hypothetical protein